MVIRNVNKVQYSCFCLQSKVQGRRRYQKGLLSEWRVSEPSICLPSVERSEMRPLTVGSDKGTSVGYECNQLKIIGYKY